MSEYERITLVDKDYQEVDDISDAVHILAQIGGKMITLRVAPGEADPLSIMYTPNRERYETEWEHAPQDHQG